jgi:hypothetical protein
MFHFELGAPGFGSYRAVFWLDGTTLPWTSRFVITAKHFRPAQWQMRRSAARYGRGLLSRLPPCNDAMDWCLAVAFITDDISSGDMIFFPES